MSVETPPFALQAGSYGAEQTRRAIGLFTRRGPSIGSVYGGIASPTDLAVTAGSGMSVIVAAGEVWVPGSSTTTQGGYYGRVTSATNLTVAASNASNPRYDLVCATVTDAAYSGSTNTFAVQVVTGTPAASPVVPSLPVSSFAVGQILVPATSTSVASGNIVNYQVVLPSYDSGWQALTIPSGFVAYGSGHRAPSYRQVGMNVKLDGALVSGSGFTTTAGLASIPIPAYTQEIPLSEVNGSTFFAYALISAGNATMTIGAFSVSGSVVALSGVYALD